MEILQNKSSKFNSFKEKVAAVSAIAEVGDVIRITFDNKGVQGKPTDTTKLLIVEDASDRTIRFVNLVCGKIWANNRHSSVKNAVAHLGGSESFLDIEIFDKDGIVLNIGESVTEEKIIEMNNPKIQDIMSAHPTAKAIPVVIGGHNVMIHRTGL